MKCYKVYVMLEGEYDRIEANDESEAFIIASDFAMSGGDWQWDVEEIEEAEE